MIYAQEARHLRESFGEAFRRSGDGSADALLASVVWREALVELDSAVLPLLFAEQGSHNGRSGALDDVMAYGLGLSPTHDVAVVLSPHRTAAPPARLHNGTVRVEGLSTIRLATARSVFVVASTDGHLVGAHVESQRLQSESITGVDPRSGLTAVHGEVTGEMQWSAVPLEAWERAVRMGRLALSFELVGASGSMLRLAREHAMTRVQFGRPVAGFQAVRHRLADALIAIEAAEALASAASDHIDAHQAVTNDWTLAGMAKAVAGRASRDVARHCQQVLAGIGFTEEHPFHLHLRRVLVLDGLLGDHVSLTRSFGQDLIDSRVLPQPPPL